MLHLLFYAQQRLFTTCAAVEGRPPNWLAAAGGLHHKYGALYGHASAGRYHPSADRKPPRPADRGGHPITAACVVSWSARLPPVASRTCAHASSKSSMRSSVAWSRWAKDLMQTLLSASR